MNVLLLNLPFPARLTRRYMCTYVSATSLFPPYELLSVAGVAKGMPGADVSVMDCVAREMDASKLHRELDQKKPDVILSLIGLESFEQDINHINALKERYPETLQVIFGHYPTTFPTEVLSNSKADILIKGEPDEVFGNLLDALSKGGNWDGVAGISFKKGDEIVHTQDKGRITRLDNLPMPAYELMDATKYFETLIPGPFALVQSSRGCPFSCNYCVTTFGSRFVAKSADAVLEELEFLKSKNHIKSFRFIDDTFTINKKRVIDICQGIIERKLNLKWTCLSRTDTLSEEALIWMKKAGCVRIYFGLESGSQRILDYYKKNVDLAEAKQTLLLCKKMGIEAVGFFMGGLSIETEEDFEQTVRFALDSKITFASFCELTLYPGTELYELNKHEIEFSLFPYVNRHKTPEANLRFERWRKEFHRKFYHRPQSVYNLSKTFVKEMSSSLQFVKNVVKAPKYSETMYPYINS